MRRWLRRFGIGIAALVGVYLALVVVARVRPDPGQTHPFFQPRPGEQAALVVAHQGGELLWPSNTMVAFRGAADLGVDVLDMDMHRTADGHLVIIHDQTVDRTSEGTGAIGDLTLAELQELDFGYSFTTDDGATYPFRGAGADQVGIVTVDHLFETFSDTDIRIGIEIKQTGPEAADELCDAVETAGLRDRVLVSSFAQPNMDAFRQACPQVATSATESEVRTFYILHRLGLSGLRKPSFDALQIPQRSAGFDLTTKAMVASADRWGIPVIPWTIDEAADMDRLLDLEVAGINTNRPDLLLERLSVRDR